MLRDGVPPKLDILTGVVSDITGITDDRTATERAFPN
jgi:hypothetical protein